jgi:hypothetical protein
MGTTSLRLARKGLADAREILARSPNEAQVPPRATREILYVADILSGAQEMLADFEMKVVDAAMQDMLAHAPVGLRLTPPERQRVAEVVRRVLDEHPGATWFELLWCLAVDPVGPRARGRKPKWIGRDGFVLVGDVGLMLAAHGLKRDSKKGLRKAIAMVQASAPARYGRYSEERLRKAYYEALPHYLAQSGNIYPSTQPWPGTTCPEFIQVEQSGKSDE